MEESRLNFHRTVRTVITPKYLPETFAVSLFLTAVVPYIIAVEEGHVHALPLPSISDCGARLPESGIFAILLSIDGILGMITISIMYEVNTDCDPSKPRMAVKHLQRMSTFLGFTTALGCFIVGAYPNISLPAVHYIGAVLAFGSSITYFLLQFMFSMILHPKEGNLVLCAARGTLSCSPVIIGFIMLILAKSYPGGAPLWMKEIFGGTSQQTYDFGLKDVHFALWEWTTVLALICNSLTYSVTFKRISMTVSTVYSDTRTKTGNLQFSVKTP
ncbi:Uncharacterised protein g8565 [Pycnogonum litorale]